MTSPEHHDWLGKTLGNGEHTGVLALGSEGDWNIGVGLVGNELVLNKCVGVMQGCEWVVMTRP